MAKKKKKQPSINTVWRRWKRKKTEIDLSNLLTHVDPVIQRSVNKFQTAPLPRIAIEAEAKKQALMAFVSYNPKKGASLKTHVGHRMAKLFRYVAKRQNIGTIPEHRVAKIGTYEKTRETLHEEKGREPTIIELADELSWSPKEVSRMEAERRKDLGHTLSFQDHAFIDFNPNMEAINFAYYSLSPQEQLVYDYSVGAHGRARSKNSEIAKRLGVSPSQISKLKKNIVIKIQKHTS